MIRSRAFRGRRLDAWMALLAALAAVPSCDCSESTDGDDRRPSPPAATAAAPQPPPPAPAPIAPAARSPVAYPTLAELPMPYRIWIPWDDPTPKILLTRRRFDMDEPSTGGTAYVSCIGPYKAWLDGAPLEIPQSTVPSWWRMHRIALPPLAKGEHVMAMRIEVPSLPEPFLMVCLDHRLANGRIYRKITDRFWKVCPQDHPGFEASAYEEKEEEGWHEYAWKFDGAWAEPWGMPANGPDDFARFNDGTHRVEAETLGRVVEHEAGLGDWISIDGKGLSARPFYKNAPNGPEIDWGGLRNMYHLIREDVFKRFNEWMDQHEARCPWLTYDLGAETFGRLKLRNAGAKKCWVVIGFAESHGELHGYNRRHGELLPIEPGESVTSEMSGCRYAKILILAGQDGDEVKLDPPVFQHVLYDLPQLGSFACSDPQVTRIWETAAHTVHLCMHQEVWDGAKRDILPWMGDLHVAALSTYHVFGCDPWVFRQPVRHTLRVLRELGPDPIVPLADSHAAGLRHLWRAKQDQEINGVAGYTLWWIIALHDYWRYTGDAEFLREAAPGLPGILRRVTARVNKDGRWDSPAKDWGTYYVDWANLPFGASAATIHVLAGRALEDGTDLLRAAGRGDEAGEFAEVAAAMRRYFDGAMRDKTTGHIVMPQTLTEKELSEEKPESRRARESAPKMHHPYAAAVEVGWLTLPEHMGPLAEPMPIHYTPWWRFHDLEAAARTGNVAWGLGQLRETWGGMLDAGATSFWETYDPVYRKAKDPHAVAFTTESIFGYGGYRASLCHGWSSGPASWLHTAVLGVRPLANGFEHFSFRPNLGDLQWAKGDVPTPHGPIRVSLERKGTRLAGTIEVPAGEKGETAIPGLDLTGPCRRSLDIAPVR